MNTKSCLVVFLALLLVGASAQADTYTDVSAMQWDTGNTASSKTAHFVDGSGFEFDVTIATSAGNLLESPAYGSELADSDGFPDQNWFGGILTFTADNFTGASPESITFQFLDVSGRQLVTEALVFSSTATPTLTTIPTGVVGLDKVFAHVGLDSSAANLVGGQYVATLAFEDVDPEGESVGNYSAFSFEATVAVPEPSTLVLAAVGLLGLIGFGRRRKR